MENEDKELSADSTESLSPTQEQGLSGRDLDAAVAERVMGWQRQPDYNYWMSFPAGGSFSLHALIATWSPSTDIATAMSVVENMRAEGWSFACTLYVGQLPYASFCKRTAASSRNAEAESLPEAICRAALKAIQGVNEPERETETRT